GLASGGGGWIVGEPIVDGLLESARSATQRVTALRRADSAVEYDGSNVRAREFRGQQRLEAALDVWNVGATPDNRVLIAWDQRRDVALPLLAGAIEDLKKALSQTPLSASVHENLGRAHWAMALVDAAHAPEHLQAALGSFSRAVASAPENPYPYRVLAMFAVPQGGRFTEFGLRAARGAVLRDPALLVGFVDRFLLLALSAPQWLSTVPETSSDRLVLGAELESRHLLGEAAEIYRAAIDIAAPPEQVVARWRLARVLLQQGKAREAIAQLQRALTDDPTNAVLHLERGAALAELGDAAALDAYQLAVQNAEVIARRGGGVGGALGQLPPRVRTVVTEVVGQASAKSDRYRQALAQYLTDHKLWESALNQWTRLAADSPKNPAAHVGRGVALEALGARERAVEAYREAVALDGSVTARAHLARALWQTDQYHQALHAS